METAWRFREVPCDKTRYLPLLLLADEQEDMIDRYLPGGRMFVLEEGGAARAVCVVAAAGGGVLEVKNLAVAPGCQRRGWGRRMLRCIEGAFAGQYAALQVGTGESPLTLPFYAACGFAECGRIPGFFTRWYDHPIWEEGVQLVDMVLLQKPLPGRKEPGI